MNPEMFGQVMARIMYRDDTVSVRMAYERALASFSHISGFVTPTFRAEASIVAVTHLAKLMRGEAK